MIGAKCCVVPTWTTSSKRSNFQEPVTWEKLDPALPPAKSAGRVRVAKQWLTDSPTASDWPAAPLRSKVWVQSQCEWERVVEGCAERGFFTLLRPDEVFHAGGAPVLNGLFLALKKRQDRSNKWAARTSNDHQRYLSKRLPSIACRRHQSTSLSLPVVWDPV